MIHLNRPHMTGNETEYIRRAVMGGKITGNGEFTYRCQESFERCNGFRKCLLATSGTDVLEMAEIQKVFHYLLLHSSVYYQDRHHGRALPNCDRYADMLVRLPLYYDLGLDHDGVLAALKEVPA